MQTTLRAARFYDRPFRRAGLSRADGDDLVPEVLAFAARPRTNADVEAWLDERLGEHPKTNVWRAFRQAGPFTHAPTGGPWSFGPRPTYVAARAQDRPGDPGASLRHLVRRYLEGFGPASIGDIAQFSLTSRASIRAAVHALAAGLVRYEGPDGGELVDVPGGLLPPEDSPAPPRLLPMWDSTLLAYADRGRIIPGDRRRIVIRTNGDVLPAILVDGHVAGVWRPVEGGIEATALQRLTDDAWEGLEAEARDLLAFLAGRDSAVYRRYSRWWTDLPGVEVRVLGR